MSNLVTSLISNKEHVEDPLAFKTDIIQYSAQILKLALDKWSTSVNQLRLQTYKALREYLNDPKSSAASQYGALMALIHLGPEVLTECVLPQLDRYVTSIEVKMNENMCDNLTNGHVNDQWTKSRRQEVYNLLYGTLGSAARTVLKAKKIKTLEVYAMLNKHFGSSLSIC